MRMPSLRPALAAVLLAVSCGSAFAGGGDDHSHADQPAAAPPAAGGAAPRRLADGSVYVPKAVQYRLGLRTVQVVVGPLAAAVELNGRVVADPNAGGRVQAGQAGRIEPGPGGLAVLGQKVARGQVLAWLRPLSGSIERGNQQAQLAELEAQLALAEKRAERLAQLEGALPQKEIDAARIEAAALARRKAAVGASLAAPEALRAPVSGVVAAVHVENGQVVEAREVLYEVVDPSRLAVEALAYDPVLADGLGEASGRLGSGELKLRFVGAGRVLREQAMPLLFRVVGQAGPLAVGQPVQVIARTRQRVVGAAVPHAALFKGGSGEPVVWVKAEPERFVPRRVETRPLDAASLAVTAGLQSGERVVAAGANLLAQIR